MSPEFCERATQIAWDAIACADAAKNTLADRCNSRPCTTRRHELAPGFRVVPDLKPKLRFASGQNQPFQFPPVYNALLVKEMADGE